MAINYQITGSDRKRLVSAISQELNLPMNYLGAPGFDFEVGEYNISQGGIVTGPDKLVLMQSAANRASNFRIPLYDVLRKPKMFLMMWKMCSTLLRTADLRHSI